MSNTASVAQTQALQLPDTEQDCLAYLHQLDTNVETYSARVYWVIGAVVQHMLKDLDVSDAVAKVATSLDRKDRLIRYCFDLTVAFTQEQVDDLTKAGMRWSSLRELTSDSLNGCRDQIVELFLSGRCTNEEIRNAIPALRKGQDAQLLLDPHFESETGETGGESSTLPGSGDELHPSVREYRKESAKLKTEVSKLSKHLREFCPKMRTKYSDVLIMPDGTNNEELLGEMLQIKAAITNLFPDMIELCSHMHIQAVQEGWPFQELDEALKNLRALYDA